ncbi:MAG: hypothetical protein WCO84_02190 [bacterium]
MKNLIAVVIIVSIVFSASPLIAGGFGDLFKGKSDTSRVITGVVIGAVVDQISQRNEQKRRDREAKAQNQRDIERNRANIKMQQEQAEELKRKEAMKDLKSQEPFVVEVESQADNKVVRDAERKVRLEARLAPYAKSTVQSTSPIFNPDGSVDFQGIHFPSQKQFGIYLAGMETAMKPKK